MDLVKLELDLRDRCREEWQIHVSSCVMAFVWWYLGRLCSTVVANQEIRQRLTAEMQVALDLTHVDPDQLRSYGGNLRVNVLTDGS